jgi:type VI secretion system secreted protein Hcp
MQIFLKIDGIVGEAQHVKHKNEIAVESYSWSEAAAPSPGGGTGLAAGKVQMQGFSVSMKASKASPKLFLAVATGQHFKTAVLSVLAAPSSPFDFLTWTLSDVTVIDFRTAGSPDVILDSITLAFTKIQVKYREQTPSGGPGAEVKAGWDLVKNQSI